LVAISDLELGIRYGIGIVERKFKEYLTNIPFLFFFVGNLIFLDAQILDLAIGICKRCVKLGSGEFREHWLFLSNVSFNFFLVGTFLSAFNVEFWHLTSGWKVKLESVVREW
jgi:hypothetical protein